MFDYLAITFISGITGFLIGLYIGRAHGYWKAKGEWVELCCLRTDVDEEHEHVVHTRVKKYKRGKK